MYSAGALLQRLGVGDCFAGRGSLRVCSLVLALYKMRSDWRKMKSTGCFCSSITITRSLIRAVNLLPLLVHVYGHHGHGGKTKAHWFR